MRDQVIWKNRRPYIYHLLFALANQCYRCRLLRGGAVVLHRIYEYQQSQKISVNRCQCPSDENETMK